MRAGLIDPHLRQDVGHVWIRADLEVHGHTNRPVCVDRLDVVAPVNAAHLLLNRRCDGLLDRLRIGAGVVGADLDLRRNDVRGYCEIGNWISATTPTIVIRTEMTIATMGRSMKKRDIALLSSDSGPAVTATVVSTASGSP